MKFKVGDRVKVVAPNEESMLLGKTKLIGDIFTINSVNPNGEHVFNRPHYGVEEDYCIFVWMEDELELVTAVQKVIYNDPATIIFWNDGTNTVAKCQKGDKYDPEKGFLVAYLKKQIGNNVLRNELTTWVKYTPPVEPTETVEEPKNNLKFKVGDYVKVVTEKCGHKFEIGSIVKIVDTCVNTHRATDDDTGESWWVTNEEIEPLLAKWRK